MDSGLFEIVDNAYSCVIFTAQQPNGFWSATYSWRRGKSAAEKEDLVYSKMTGKGEHCAFGDHAEQAAAIDAARAQIRLAAQRGDNC